MNTRVATHSLCATILFLITGGLTSVSASVDLEYIRFFVYTPSRLDINWQTHSETANSLFELWRADSALGPYSLDHSLSGAGTSTDPHDYWCWDSGLGRNQRYFYYLSATDTAGNSEVVSDTVSGRTAPADITGVGGFPICPEGNRVSWTVRYEYDVLDYIVRRGAWAGCSETIVTVPAVGDTDSWRSYQYIDLTAPPRVNTYCVTARRADSTTYTPLVFYIPEEPQPEVALDSFFAIVEPASVTISWTTGLEYWLRCFQVQRRRDGDSSYTVVAQVQGG